ncbi:MAG: DUF2510 domain-containing protein [Actinomycetota bacterium]|nr:DUF2510 domain-containing protein [Actinomycetota bacterium]
MTDIITPQAGWYPDPTDSRAYRWWSGGAWTDHLTAAPSAESVWSGGSTAGQAVAVGADAFTFTEQGTSPFTSSYEEPWGNTIRPVEKNRTGLAVAVVGLVSVAGYLGSMAFGYSTIFPLIPALLGLIVAVPAFRRSRITGDGLAVSLLGVVLSGVGGALSILPLLPMILGIPSATDVNNTTSLITNTVGFHVKVQNELVAGAAKDFGQAATAAACPADALPQSGSTFLCTETLADGTQKALTVTVKDDSGTVTWTPAA